MFDVLSRGFKDARLKLQGKTRLTEDQSSWLSRSESMKTGYFSIQRDLIRNVALR